MSEKTPAQILSEAADFIEKHGLALGSYYESKTDNCCTVGAMAYVSGWTRPEDFIGLYLDKEPVRLAIDAIAGLLGRDDNDDPETAIVHWSDGLAESENPGEVVAKLREAAGLVSAIVE